MDPKIAGGHSSLRENLARVYVFLSPLNTQTPFVSIRSSFLPLLKLPMWILWITLGFSALYVCNVIGPNSHFCD